MRSLFSARFFGATAALLLGATAVAAPEKYEVDPVHSTVLYNIKYMGVTQSRGAFRTFKGTFTLDKEKAENNAVDFTIKADSIDSFNAKRDEHLRGPDFLNAKEHAEITFKSTKATKVDETTLKLDGDVSFRGVSKPYTVTTKLLGEADNKRYGHVAGNETVLVLKRKDHGMTYMDEAFGEDIEVTISVMGKRQGDAPAAAEKK